MTWVRSNIQNGARLALLTLAIQFALAFGHFHAAGVASTTTATVSSALSTDHSHFSHELPCGGGSEDAADVCAICAVMAMGDALILASSPALIHWAAVRSYILGPIDTPVRLALSRRGTPMSRAPPAS